MEYAQAWLAEGPPYFGDSEFKDKGEMYKCGGRFDKEKKLWKAIDEDSFVNMVESDKWTPKGVDGKTAVRVIQLRRQREQEAKSKKAYEEAAAKNKRPVLTAEQAEAKARKESGIPNDTPDELSRLWDNFEITPPMAKKTFHWGSLGPKGGKSDASRLLSGLKWGIVTKEEVWAGVQEEPATSKNARRMREQRDAKLRAEGREVPLKKQKVAHAVAKAAMPADPYSREGAKLFFESAVAQDDGPLLDHNVRQQTWKCVDIKWVPDTVCTECRCPVSDQFLDCSCDLAVWVRCGKCGEKHRTDKHVGMFNQNKLCKCRSKIPHAKRGAASKR